MMTVTKIEPLSKTRYKVYLDGQFAFTLYKGELSRYHIAEESVIEDDIYDSLRLIVIKRAKLRAMHLLSDMGRTESQLRTKLKQGGYAEDAVEAVKDWLGIASPSKLMRDEVGKYMALGMGIGFEKNIPVGSMNAGVQKAVQSLQRSVQLTTSVNPDKTVGGIKA